MCTQCVVEMGFRSLESQPTWFVRFDNGKIDCMIINYVDDLMVFGLDECRRVVCGRLGTLVRLKVKHLNVGTVVDWYQAGDLLCGGRVGSSVSTKSHNPVGEVLEEHARLLLEVGDRQLIPVGCGVL